MAIGLSHETASLIVATVPELPAVLLSPKRNGLATTTVEEEGARYLALRQGRPRIGLSSPYMVSPIIDMSTASGYDRSDCSLWESPGYLTPANPKRQG